MEVTLLDLILWTIGYGLMYAGLIVLAMVVFALLLWGFVSAVGWLEKRGATFEHLIWGFIGLLVLIACFRGGYEKAIKTLGEPAGVEKAP